MAATTIKKEIAVLPNNSRVNGYTHVITIGHADLTETTTNTAHTFSIDIPAHTYVRDALLDLVTPFEDKSDTAFNSTTITVGDTDTAAQYISATQVNVNGTEVLVKAMDGTARLYADGTDDLVISVGSMSAKSLSNIDAGEARVYLNLAEPGTLG